MRRFKIFKTVCKTDRCGFRFLAIMTYSLSSHILWQVCDIQFLHEKLYIFTVRSRVTWSNSNNCMMQRFLRISRNAGDESGQLNRIWIHKLGLGWDQIKFTYSPSGTCWGEKSGRVTYIAVHADWKRRGTVVNLAQIQTVTKLPHSSASVPDWHYYQPRKYVPVI